MTVWGASAVPVRKSDSSRLASIRTILRSCSRTAFVYQSHGWDMSQSSEKIVLSDTGLAPQVEIAARPRVAGKFLFVGDEKLYIRGVTYGTFRPDEHGNEYNDPDLVSRDLAQMAAHGINAVRTYTVPPRWFLDSAQQHDIHVMVGLPWEQHIAFLDESGRARAIEESVRAGIRACARHPAVLGYTLGNEIPTAIVRWHGKRRVERYLERLYRAAKAEDPGGLVTYVNYPSTEYLELPFLDFVCFNVYLESQDRFEAYLARLHNLAGELPLIIAEIGLDSRRNGRDTQAFALDWQVRTAFSSGCAGAFVFAWTDEWHRGGHDIEDWDFGITARDRSPKPALVAVSEAFAQVPFRPNLSWPRISAVVCTHNGERTIRECLQGLLRLEYPDHEVIVVDDGSIDDTAQIVAEYPVRLISTPNRGLSSARNTGLEAATGEIVAYIDDDAYPDPHWLTYLAATFMSTDFVGVGGPNIAPPTDGLIAECVANAPGGPVHVLLSDREAEHIPGCNMAFRKAALQAIGGFDTRFRVAGDDVDVCWRLQERGWAIGFSAAAVVWHHRRNSLRAYWKQQRGYGKAEAMLERKWPQKYNAAGHLNWSGRLYGRGPTLSLAKLRSRIYGGSWGSAPFQSVYEPSSGTFWSLSMMPEWYLIILMLAGFSLLGLLWTPLLLTLPLLAGAVAAPLLQAGLSAARARYSEEARKLYPALPLRALTGLLHLAQPLARLWGRLRHGLVPWRYRASSSMALPRPRRVRIWSESWQSPEDRLRAIQHLIKSKGAAVSVGGDYDRWDLEVRGGLLGSARLLLAVEEHGEGKQYVLIRIWPKVSMMGLLSIGLSAALTTLAVLDGAWIAGGVLAAAAALLAVRTAQECGTATASVQYALHTVGENRV